jgi:hypothetical protein
MYAWYPMIYPQMNPIAESANSRSEPPTARIEDALDVDGSLDLPLLLLVGALEEREHGLDDGSLVHDVHGQATVAEGQVIAGVEDHQTLEDRHHGSPHREVAETVGVDHVVQGERRERRRAVEVRQEVPGRPHQDPVARLLPPHEKVQLCHVPHEEAHALDVGAHHFFGRLL